MKYCPACGLRYGEGPVYCDEDGAVLLEEPPAGPGDRAAAPAGAGVPTWLSGVAGLALGAALCAAAFFAYLYFAGGGDEPQPTVAPSKTADGAPSVRRERPDPAAAVSSEPEETETPEPSPSPSPTPPPAAPPPATQPRLAPVESLSTTPATTEGRSSERVVLHLDDGTTVEADAAWAASDAVWYRRGTILQSIDRGRVRGVESKPAPEP